MEPDRMAVLPGPLEHNEIKDLECQPGVTAHTDSKGQCGEVSTLRAQLARANRIIGWMLPYIGSMCPSDGGLGELNEHFCDNKIPDFSKREDTKGRPLNQRPPR